MRNGTENGKQKGHAKCRKASKEMRNRLRNVEIKESEVRA